MNKNIKTIQYNNIKFKYIYNNIDTSGIGCIHEIIKNDEYKLFKFVNKNGIFIDIGGNHGLVTIILAIQNPNATIYVLEPHPGLIEIIKNNIEINNIKNVIVINKALGDDKNVKQVHL
jgi:tRNA A22 N-methylase